MERKLATIKQIDKLEPIEGADKILKATIGGWHIVTAKDNGFKEGDLVVYLEVDSWVPTEIAPFLSRGQEPKEFNGIKGERLRTIKLRGQISQGLILPLSVLDGNIVPQEGTDLTEVLGIQKYEKPIPTQLAGIAKGNFPSFIPKTDEERLENLRKEFQTYKEQNLTFEVTEKLEGSSMTVFYRNIDGIIETGVCSRNINLVETTDNSFWIAARKYRLLEKLTELNVNVALQMELIGPSVQGNIYGLKELEIRLFNVYNINTQKYLDSNERLEIAEKLQIETVPVIMSRLSISAMNIEDILALADGTSMLANTLREGLVFKSIEDPSVSFKSISKNYLLGEKC